MIINGILVALNAKLLRGKCKGTSLDCIDVSHADVTSPGLRGPQRSMYGETLGFYQT
jgi:hypothetical protein